MPQLAVPAPVIAQQAAGGTSVFMLVMFAALLLLMFLSFRKSKKVQQQQAELRSSLVPGEEVMTAAGLFGTVVSVDADGQRATLQVSPGVNMDVHLQTVTTRVSDLPAAGAAGVVPAAETTAPAAETTAPAAETGGAHAAAPSGVEDVVAPEAAPAREDLPRAAGQADPRTDRI